MWRNFSYLHICRVKKCSPHDRFFSTGTTRDKYQVCTIPTIHIGPGQVTNKINPPLCLCIVQNFKIQTTSKISKIVKIFEILENLVKNCQQFSKLLKNFTNFKKLSELSTLSKFVKYCQNCKTCQNCPIVLSQSTRSSTPLL